MRNHKNVQWGLPKPVKTWDQANTAVLMDIRDELQQLNRVFACHNFLAIPHTLSRIEKNTKKRKRRTR